MKLSKNQKVYLKPTSGAPLERKIIKLDRSFAYTRGEKGNIIKFKRYTFEQVFDVNATDREHYSLIVSASHMKRKSAKDRITYYLHKAINFRFIGKEIIFCLSLISLFTFWYLLKHTIYGAASPSSLEVVLLLTLSLSLTINYHHYSNDK